MGTSLDGNLHVLNIEAGTRSALVRQGLRACKAFRVKPISSLKRREQSGQCLLFLDCAVNGAFKLDSVRIWQSQ